MNRQHVVLMPVNDMLGHEFVGIHGLNDPVETIFACNQLALLPEKVKPG